MLELDQFEARVAAAVRAFADGADTRVDPVAVAHRAVGRRHFGTVAWLGRPVPVPLPVLLVLGLLLALLALSVGVGALRDRDSSFVPALFASASAAPAATPGSVPTPSPSTDANGDEYVSGSGLFSIVAPGTSTRVGTVTQVRGFLATAVDTMNDARVSGTGTLRLSIDTYGSVGTEWGTYRLVNTQGAWQGDLSGAAWSDGNASDVSGWLVGSGAYEGYTYYIHVRSWITSTEVTGIVYPGSPG